MVRVVKKVDVKEDAAPVGVVPVVALLAVALRIEDVDPVALGSNRHQIQKSFRIDDRIGQSEKEENPHVCCG